MSGSPGIWVDRCVCTHVKDKHQVATQAGKVWAGPCRACRCLRFAKSSIEEEIGATVDPPRGIDAAVRPGNAPFADTPGEGPGSAPVGATAGEAAYWTEDADGDPVIPDPPAEAPCCPGEPLYGDPRGLHTFDCPVYLANVEAWEEWMRKTRPSLLPIGSRQLPTPRVRAIAPRPEAPLESFDAWRCPRCGSRSWRRNRCCVDRWMEPVTVTISRRAP